MMRGAKAPLVHTSWEIPPGTAMESHALFVPVPTIESVASFLGLIKFQRPVFNVAELKSSEMRIEARFCAINVESDVVLVLPTASIEVIR